MLLTDCELFSDGKEISHAVCSQKLASKNDYKSDYVQDLLGKAPADLANSYPEHEHQRKMAKLASKVGITRLKVM